MIKYSKNQGSKRWARIRIQYNDQLHASNTSRPSQSEESRLSRSRVPIWNLVCYDKHVPMIDEIFPKSNYNFWRLTKTSYKPPGHQGQANLRSRHSASGVPIWNLWSRQRLPSLGVVLTHTHTGQKRPARGKKPEKNTSATASLDSSTEIEISLSLSLGITGSDCTTLFTRSSAFSNTRPCFVLG